MTPIEIQIRCADCGHPVHGQPLEGRCTRCHLVHGIVTYADTLHIATTVVRSPLTRGRVSATGADGRPAWLDSHTDVLYLHRDLQYMAPVVPLTSGTDRTRSAGVPTGWAFEHDHCRTCATTDRPHFRRGYCCACYFKARRAGGFAVPADTTVRMAA